MESLRVSVISRFTAVAAAGGNDAITAGLSAGSGELAAPMIAKWMFGTDSPEKLTAEQKATVSNITGLIGTGAGATTGNVTDAIASGRASENAVDNNHWTPHEREAYKDLLKVSQQCQNVSPQQCGALMQEAREKHTDMTDEEAKIVAGVLMTGVSAGGGMLAATTARACLANPIVCREVVADILAGESTGGGSLVVGGAAGAKITAEVADEIGKRLDDAARGATTAGEVIPGLSRPVRGVNPHYPANQNVVDYMNGKYMSDYKMCEGNDCSDIAEKLLDVANGKGYIMEVRPADKFDTINIFENGKIEPEGMVYHQVYTDGRYVYDPRVSNNPIPKGDWEKHIRGINKDKNLIFSNNPKGQQ